MWPHPRQLRTVRHVRAPPGREKRSEETEPWLPAIFQEPVTSLCRPVSPTPGKKRSCRPSFEKWPRCYDARLASRRTGCRGAPVAVTSWCREDRSFQNLSSAFASDISVSTKRCFCSFASASLCLAASHGEVLLARLSSGRRRRGRRLRRTHSRVLLKSGSEWGPGKEGRAPWGPLRVRPGCTLGLPQPQRQHGVAC